MYILDKNKEKIEKLEDIIIYYKCLGVENMLNKRPEFVKDDFELVLKILEEILEV